MGRAQVNRVLDAADPAQAAAFAAEVCDALGRCDALVVAPGPIREIPFDELSRDEWTRSSPGRSRRGCSARRHSGGLSSAAVAA